MSAPLILDVETQNTFQEVSFDYAKLKVSLVGTYDFNTDEYLCYRENDLNRLFNKMEHASWVIGFNIRKFDLPVLKPYYLGNMKQFEVIDLLELTEQSLGFRVSLDSLARSTLKVKKSGHGLLAIDYFRSGEWEKLESYCLDDVKITKELYDYILKNGKLIFDSYRGPLDVKIKLPEIKAKDKSVSLSLPF